MRQRASAGEAQWADIVRAGQGRSVHDEVAGLVKIVGVNDVVGDGRIGILADRKRIERCELIDPDAALAEDARQLRDEYAAAAVTDRLDRHGQQTVTEAD